MTGIQLKEELKKRGITQEKASELLGIARTTLTMWFGRQSIDDATLYKINTKLGIPIDCKTEQIGDADDYLQKIISTQDETIASQKELINNLRDEVERLKKQNADLHRLARTSNAG